MPNNNWKVTIGAELDKSAEKQIDIGLEKLKPKPIEVPFNIDFKNSNEIEKEMNRLVDKITKGRGSLSSFKIDKSTIFDEEKGKRVENLNAVTVKYKNEIGELISELYKYNQISTKIHSDGTEEAIMGWSKATANYSQNIEQSTKNLRTHDALLGKMKTLQINTDKSDISLSKDTLDKFNIAAKNKDIDAMRHYLGLAREEYTQLNALMVKDLPITGLENMKKNISTMDVDIQNVDTSFKRLQVRPDEVRVKIDQLSESFKALGSFKGTEEEKVKQYNLLKNAIGDVKKEIGSLIAIEKQQVSLDDKTKFGSSIKTWANENTKGAKYFRVELERIQRELIGADKTKFTALKKEFGAITSQTVAMGKAGRTAFQEIGNNFKKFSSWFGVSSIVMSTVRSMKNMVNEVKVLDSALIDLKKVTDESDATYEKFLTNSAQKAKDLGSSISDLVESTADFARLGYSIEESSKLAEVATLYKNVGDGINIEQATASMISTLKAFNIEAKDSITVIDKFNEVGKHKYAQAA